MRCLEIGCPCLPVLPMGEVAQIGPIVQSGPATACVDCADTRMAAVTGRSGLDANWPLQADLCKTLLPRILDLLRDWDGTRATFTNALEFLSSINASSTHPVQRRAACPTCASHALHVPFRHPKTFPIRTDARPDQGLILRLEGQLVDPLTGPITGVETLNTSPGLPVIHHAIAHLVDPGWFKNGRRVLDCGGNELDATSARGSALGEAIERASASEVWPGHLSKGPWTKFQNSAVAPEAFDNFLAADRNRPDFPYTRLDFAQDVHWDWGTDLAQETPVRAPASRVYVPFVAPDPEPAMDYPLLSGFAAGASRESALLSALLEVIERDTFMIAWANKLPLQPVDLASNHRLTALTDVFEKIGIEVRVGVLQLDLGAPVAIAIARSDQPGHPATVVSAASAMTPAHASEKALSELTANWMNVHHTMATTALPPSDAPHLIRDETAHGLLYAKPEMAAHLDYWWDSPAPRLTCPEIGPEPTPGQSCLHLIQTMTRSGVRPIVVDLTTPALSEMGLFTVKCVAPGSYGMNFDALWPQLGGARMTEAPVRAGLRTMPLQLDQLNRTPHPFP